MIKQNLDLNVFLEILLEYFRNSIETIKKQRMTTF